MKTLHWERVATGWQAYEMLPKPPKRTTPYRFHELSDIVRRKLFATVRPSFNVDGTPGNHGWVVGVAHDFALIREFSGPTALDDAKLHVESLFALTD